MEDAKKGFEQQRDSVPEVGEDAVAATPPSSMTEEERQELQEQLVKVEDEILTLSQVLAAKERQLAHIKIKLGITPLDELKQNFSKTWQDVTASTAYRRTSETLSLAGQKATEAFSNVGTAITRKLEDVRNAPTFKSFEEKVKTKMSPSASISDDAGEPESGSQPDEDLPTQEKPKK